MFLIGSHDSCGYEPLNTSCVSRMCWLFAKTQRQTLREQYDSGVRLFDLRYRKLGNEFMVSHTLFTSYSLKDALLDLLEIANDRIYIRLKRDSTINQPIGGLQDALATYKFNDISVLSYMILNNGQPFPGPSNDKGKGKGKLVMWTDNSTPLEDGLSQIFVWGQIFDTVETYMYNTLVDAVRAVEDKQFKNNGLPKMIFLDWSSYLPPLIAGDLLIDKVFSLIVSYRQQGLIQGVMINSVDPRVIKRILTDKSS